MGKVELKLEVDAELLAKAEAAGAVPLDLLNAGLRAVAESSASFKLDLVSSAREKAKDPEGAERRAREWAEENRGAIEDHNAAIRRRGLVSDRLRRW